MTTKQLGPVWREGGADGMYASEAPIRSANEQLCILSPKLTKMGHFGYHLWFVRVKHGQTNYIKIVCKSHHSLLIQSNLYIINVK